MSQAEKRPQGKPARRQDRGGISRALNRNEDPNRALRRSGYRDQPISALDDMGQDIGEPGASQTDGLKLRLDLNLTVDILIKVRVHGDVTLSLLSG
ncbi:hypothetical protein DFS33DRAFT_1377174 [Desarmillaria ectypa]|nr:hypothetical protein DFS33DRAFT_1377174 [Desarmillaria ectypa]